MVGFKRETDLWSGYSRRSLSGHGCKNDEAIREKIKNLIADVKDTLNTEEIQVESIHMPEGTIGQISVSLKQTQDIEKAKEVIEKEYAVSLLGTTALRVLSTSGNTLVLGYNELEIIRLRKSIIEQVVEVLRRRIDEFGVSEPIITAQGDDRVLVQLPGVQDSVHAREIIQRTARLEFRLVNQEITAEQLIQWVSEAEEKGGYFLSPQFSYQEYIIKLMKTLQIKSQNITHWFFKKRLPVILYKRVKFLFWFVQIVELLVKFYRQLMLAQMSLEDHRYYSISVLPVENIFRAYWTKH